MRNLKRVLSLALACVMVIGMMVMTTGAADLVDYDEITRTEAVDVMSALGVLEGDENGNFNPTGILTREQAAKIICYMLMGKESAEKLPGSSNFTDVAADRWSAPFIAYCDSLDIIEGNGDGTFNPTGELTGVAFAKMLLVALGYDAEIEGYIYNNNWATNIGSDAIDAKINIKGVDLAVALTRENAAQMALNTLKADMVKYAGTGTTITTGDTTIVTGAGEAKEIENDDYSYVGAAGVQPDNYVNGVSGTLQFCEKYFPTLKIVPATDAFQRDADQWFLGINETDTAYTPGIDKPVSKPVKTADYTVLVTRDGEDLNDWIDTISYSLVVDFTTTTVDTLDDTTLEYLNGDLKTAAPTGGSNAATSWFDTAANFKVGDTIELFMETDGKTVDKVIVSRYEADVVNSDPDGEVSVADKNNRVKYYTSFKNAVATKDTDVPGFDAETYVKNAVVALAVKGDNSIIDSYVMDSVSGPITAWKASDNTYTMNGTGYELNGNATDTAIAGNPDFETGVYELFLDNNGYVLYTKVVSAAAATLADVYYIVDTYYTTESTYNGGSTYTYYAQVVDFEGNKDTIEIGLEQFNGLKAYNVKLADINDADSDGVIDDGETFKAGANAAGIGTIASTDELAKKNGVLTLTKVTDDSTTYAAATTYYKQDTTKIVAPGGLYSFEDVERETYKAATAYNPRVGKALVGRFNQTGALTGRETTIDAYKVTADTQFILVNGTLDNLKVKTYTGGVNMSTFTNNANEDVAIYAKDENGNKIASHILLLTTDNTQGATSYAAMLYNDGSDARPTLVEDGYTFEMYDLKGEKVTVLTKNAPSLDDNFFYTYAVDEKGYYTFTKKNDSFDFDDLAFVTDGYMYGLVYSGLYGTKVTASNGTAIVDVEASNAKIIDLRNPAAKAASVYTNDIASLNAIHAAYQKGAITFDAYATKADGITLIFVQSVDEYTVANTGDSEYVTYYTNPACTNAIASGSAVTAGTTVYFKATGTVATTDFTGISYSDIKLVSTGVALASDGNLTADTAYSFTMPYADVAEADAS